MRGCDCSSVERLSWEFAANLSINLKANFVRSHSIIDKLKRKFCGARRCHQILCLREKQALFLRPFLLLSARVCEKKKFAKSFVTI